MTNEEMGAEALRHEMARLRDAKRRALAIAHERAKENVALRVEIERLHGAGEKHTPARSAKPATAKADAKSAKRSKNTKPAKSAKRRGRPATGKGLQINVRCQPDFLARVDKWRGRKLSRPQAIRSLAEIGLSVRASR